MSISKKQIALWGATGVVAVGAIFAGFAGLDNRYREIDGPITTNEGQFVRGVPAHAALKVQGQNDADANIVLNDMARRAGKHMMFGI